VVSFVVYTPNSWTPAQVNAMADRLINAPATVFTPAFLAAYPDIAGITVLATSPLPSGPATTIQTPTATPDPAAPAAGALSKNAQIGIGVGAGAGGTLLIAGAALGIHHLRRKRRAAVEPRNDLGAVAEDAA
jgi:hypothetical protein